MHARLCVSLASFYIAVAFRASTSTRSKKETADANIDTGRGFQRFRFTNNASLPLNILALPKTWRLYSKAENDVQPRGVFDLSPGMFAYNFHVTINDGHNGWVMSDETGWGLTKDGAKIVIGHLAGAGVAGTLAVVASAAVTGALASVAAPAVVAIAGIATYWGVAVFSSMAAGFLTENSMDLIRDRMHILSHTHTHRNSSELNESIGQSDDATARLYRFTDVVTELPVRTAFQASYPTIDVDNVVMSRAAAETYFNAMQSEFKDWRLYKGFERNFILTGGFMEPTPIVHDAIQGSQDNPCLKVEFVPLHVGEVQPTYGCRYPDQDLHWITQAQACKHMCVDKLLGADVNGTLHHGMTWNDMLRGKAAKAVKDWPAESAAALESCRDTCTAPFLEALQQDLRKAAYIKKIKDFVSEEVHVIGDKALLREASTAAALDKANDDARERQMYAMGRILKVDTAMSKAKVAFGFPLVIWFPLEALAKGPTVPFSFAEPLLEPTERFAFVAAPRFGECWSKCRASEGFWNKAWHGMQNKVKKLGGGLMQCHAALAPQEDTPPFGALCSADDDCGQVVDADPSLGEDASWGCTGTCA